MEGGRPLKFKKIGWSISITFLVFFTLGFFTHYNLPRIKDLILTTLAVQTDKNAPVLVTAQSVEIYWLPFKLQFSDIKITPKNDLAEQISTISIKTLEVQPSWLDLLTGELRLARMFIQSPVLAIFFELPQNLENNKNEQDLIKELLKQYSFDRFTKIPIDELEINKANALIRITNRPYAFKVIDFDLLFENRFQSLVVQLKALKNQITQVGVAGLTEFSFETRFLVDPNSLNLGALKLLMNDHFLISSGRINLKSSSDEVGAEILNGQINLRAKFDLQSLQKELLPLTYPQELPELQGKGEIDLSLSLNDPNNPKMNSSIKLEDLGIDRFFIGKIESEIQATQHQIQIAETIVQNSAGLARLRDLQLDIEKERVSLLGKAIVDEMEVGQLLNQFQIITPMILAVTGTSVCRGELIPSLEIQCQPELTGDYFKIWTPSNEKTIVELKDFSAGGEVVFKKEGLQYQAELKLGENSKGFSSGKIFFEDGFDIEFTESEIDFADVSNLADLELEGAALLEAKTRGNARSATFNIQSSASDFFIKNYFIEKFSGKIGYESGQLTIDSIQGSIDSSRFEANMKIHFLDDQINLDARLPIVDLAHIKKSIQRAVAIPIEMRGSGEAQIKLWGPLDVTKLNFNLDAQFYRGILHKEPFDDLVGILESRDGVLSAKTVKINKGEGKIDVFGSMTLDGQLDLQAHATQLKIEQIETLEETGIDLNGSVNLNVKLAGSVQAPEFELSALTQGLMSGTQPTGDSQFIFKANAELVSLYGNFFGPQLWVDFSYPLKSTQPLLLKAKMRDWSYTQIFKMFSENIRSRDYATKISADIDLQSADGSLEDLVGYIEVDQFLLRRGEIELKNILPITAALTKDQISISQFELLGPQSFLNLNVKDGNRKQVHFDLSARLDLTLFAIFTPFLQDLRGELSASTQIRGPLFDPNVLGSALIDRGFVSIPQFPHSLQNLRVDLLFSPQNILINSINGQFAKGRISGDGQIRFGKKGQTPVSIQTQFKEVQIKFPDGFDTFGSGTLEVVGDQFPYEIQVKYGVDKATVSMELGGKKQGATEELSPYFPTFLSEEVFQPVNLNLDIQLLNPAELKNSLAKASIDGSIKILGPPDQLKLTGILTPRPGGQIIFRENTFEIVSGFVEYRSDPPDNPSNIYLSAKARVTEIIPTESREIRNDYDVNILVQGQAKDPRISLDSTPALSEREIVSLLALGITSATALDQNLTRGDQQTGAAPGVIGSQVGAQLFQTGLGQEFKQRLGVEVKVGSAFNIAENASFPRVTFVKQWTPKFESSASRTIEPNPISDVRVEYRLNTNTSAVGFWEGRQENINQDFRQLDSSRIGLDLEYRIEFK